MMLKRENVFVVLVVCMQLFIGACSGDHPDSSLSSEVDFLASQGMRIGGGYDSSTGESRGDCVATTPLEDVSMEQTGLESDGFVQIVEDKSSLEKALGLKADVSASFVVGSVSVKTEFVQKAKLSRSSKSLFFYRRVVKGTKVMRNVAMKPEYQNELKDPKNAMTFFSACGNSYVSGLTSGGEMLALLTLETSNGEDEATFNGAINASALSNGAKVDINTFNRETFSQFKFSAFVHKTGGKMHTGHMSIDEAGKSFLDFPADVERDPRPFSAVIEPYASTIKSDFKTYMPALNLLERNLVTLDLMRKELSHLKQLTDAMEPILKAPNDYFFSSGQSPRKLGDDYRAMSSRRNALSAKVLDCRQNGQCNFEPSDDSVRSYELPIPLRQNDVVKRPVTIFGKPSAPSIGDPEFYGSPNATIHAALRVTEQNVILTIGARWTEGKGDNSTAEIATDYVLYTVPSGYKIEDISLKNQFWVICDQKIDGHGATLLTNPGGLNGQVEVFGDSDMYNDIGQHTQYKGILNFDFTVTRKKN